MKVNKNKKIFIITLTFLMLIGLTTITATETNTNDTTTITETDTIDTPTIETNTKNYDTRSTTEESTKQLDNIQENDYQETLNNKNGEKTQNLKASRTVSVSGFNELNNTLTSNTYDTVTINIDNNIQLADSIIVNKIIKNLTINGNGKTINGNNNYRFLYINHAINFTLNNLNITNCKDTDQGSYTNRGGAILLGVDNNGCNITVNKCSFINNTAESNGGAIYIINSGNMKEYPVSLTVINSSFIDNTAGGHGGAISSWNSHYNITVIDSIFTNNTAKSNFGGAIFGHNGNIIAINNNFTKNSAKLGGGAIHGYGKVSIINSSFINNSAYDDTYTGGSRYGGGAINNRNSNVINCSFINNTANTFGGAIFGKSKITNTSFINNTAGMDGGAIYGEQGVYADNSSFINNSAKNGGAIYCPSVWPTIHINLTNITFINNNALINGGAIYSEQGVYVNNSSFINNTAKNGGAIFRDNTIYNCSITDSIFINNTAKDSGGAIYSTTYSSSKYYLIVNNSTFINNSAIYGGAIYGNTSNNITLLNSTFTNNTAEHGGGIYGETNSIITLNNTQLTHNNATQYGGAIYGNTNSTITLNNTQLINNTVNGYSVYGGAIYVYRSNMTINNSNLTHNTANGQYGSGVANGGAIYGSTSNIIVTQSNLTHNNATEYGGAICVYGNITINNTNLTHNNARAGGAILGTSNMTITQSNLTHNNATQAGAISVAGNIIITQSNLTHNNANQHGGAIYGLDNITVINSNFTDNKATLDGGAIYGQSNITVTNSTFTNNIAYSGGAIMGCTNSTMMITASNFTNNIANGFGGAIYGSLNSNMTIKNTTLTYNTANYDGGAIYGSSKSNLTITNTNLTLNHAKNGGAIGEHTSNVTITNSNLINNTATLNGGAICGQGKITVTNSNLTNNHANEGGGVIHGHYCNITITSSNVTNNHANESGGVIYDYEYCNITLKNSNITDNYVTSDIGYVVESHSANSIIITDNIFINNTDNARDMLFSDAGDNVDIHSNSYIDNFLEVTIVEPEVNIVTDNEAGSYDYYIDLNLRDVYNDTVRNGTLNVYVNGVLKDSDNVTEGRARILFGNSDLTKRENNITLEYISLSKHYQNTTKNFTVYKEINTTLTIQAPTHMNPGDTAEINFTLKDANNKPVNNETIHVLVDEEQVATITTDANGVATYNFSAFGDELVRIVGTHHTSNDSFYLSAMDAEAEIDVNKIQPEIIIKHDTLIPYVETNITIHLFDPDGNPIKNKTLTVNITEEGRPNITGTVTTDGNGMCVFNFTPVDEGILNVNVTSPSDDIYHYASESVQISRYFITTNLVVDASTTIINKTNTIHVEVLPDDGALLSGTVELDINGEIHTLNITNGRGTYHDYKSSTAGEKLVNAKFTSNNPSYTNATTTEEFNVEKLPTHVTIEAINRTAGNVTLKVQVFPKNNTGSIVNGGNIVIESVNGENSKVIYNSTLENGELIYLTDINETGWYEFETIYHGNDYFYGEENNTGSIQVLLVDTDTVTYDKTALVGDTITLNATVNDNDGNPVSEGNVTFHVDGNPVEAKLENGIATTEYTLPTTYQAGRYIIKANYQGNNKYNISSGESELKVQSPSTVTVDAVEGLVLDNVTFTANVRDYHGNPVTGGYVVFKVGGKTLTYDNGTQIRTPVVNGIAQLSYQAESGWIIDSHPDLTVEATYSGTSVILSGRSDTAKVTIYKRNATVQVSAPDDYVNGTLHIDAIVKDQNGSLINDGVLVFKLNGLSVKDENNKGIVAKVVNGEVHLDVKLPFAYSAKTYNLTAVYSNKIYNKTTGTNTTSLKAIPTYINATVTIKDQFSKPVITGQIYNKFNNAILQGTAVINIKFDGISYAKKVKINNGTFTETLEGIPIYKPGTHKVEIAAGANSHYEAVRKTITSKTTPKYNVNTVITNITRNKTTTRVQAKIVDDKNKNVQRDLRITIKLNGKSFLINKTVTNGKVDVLVDTSTLKNRTYNLEIVSGANTYYNAGKATAELPKY